MFSIKSQQKQLYSRGPKFRILGIFNAYSNFFKTKSLREKIQSNAELSGLSFDKRHFSNGIRSN